MKAVKLSRQSSCKAVKTVAVKAFKLSKHSSCHSIIAFNCIYCSHLNLFFILLVQNAHIHQRLLLLRHCQQCLFCFKKILFHLNTCPPNCRLVHQPIVRGTCNNNRETLLYAHGRHWCLVRVRAAPADSPVHQVTGWSPGWGWGWSPLTAQIKIM